MEILNNEYWSNYLKPYVADLGVALAFGVGFYLFKSMKKDKQPMGKTLKESIKSRINKWSHANTVQKFNSLIISNNDKETDAFKILNSMQKAEKNPDIITYNCLLFMSFKLNHVEQAKKLFEEISDFTSPVQPDVVTFNILLKGMVKEIKENQENKTYIKSLVNRVNRYTNELKSRGLKPDDFTYNTIIDAFVEGGSFDLAWEYYDEMRVNKSPSPDLFTYTTLIKGLKNNQNFQEKNLEKVLEIFDMIKEGKIDDLKADEFLYNSVLDTCVKFNKMNLAERIFNSMKLNSISPSAITYSILLKGYSNQSRLEQAIEKFNEMKLIPLTPNEIVYDCLLNCAIKAQRLDIMNDIYENMKLDNIAPNSVIFSTLIKGFNRMKKYDLAYSLFEKMSTTQLLDADIVLYNSMLDCCVEGKNYEKMLYIHNLIQEKSEKVESFQPTVITYSTLLKGYTKNNKIDLAKQLYNKMKNSETNLVVDEVFYNTMAEYYAGKKDISSVLSVLKDMKENNVIRSSVIYSIIIKMYSLLNQQEKALETYDDMKSDGIKPSIITYTTVMQMFIKQKKMDHALKVFNEMKSEGVAIDIVTYNFIINGCSFNKRLEDAIEILLMSLRDNVIISDNTYHNVLEYLASNKFMKHNDRCYYATEILKELKEKDIQVRYETYSKIMRFVYKNNSIENNNNGNYNNNNYNGNNNNNHSNNNKKKVIDNFKNFSSNGFHKGSKYTNNTNNNFNKY